jgi:hypothetical protein
MNYDRFVFIEIIESVPGILFLRQDSRDGISARFYQGLGGNLVMIDITEEEITEDTGKGHLTQLGLAYLIPALFPEEPTTTHK